MNYRQVDTAASIWRRAYQVTINNYRNAIPSIVFAEEDAITVQGETVRLQTGPGSAVQGNFTPEGVISLINPETGVSLGASVTHQELYVILHSLYIQLALVRDALENPPLPQP